MKRGLLLLLGLSLAIFSQAQTSSNTNQATEISSETTERTVSTLPAYPNPSELGQGITVDLPFITNEPIPVFIYTGTGVFVVKTKMIENKIRLDMLKSSGVYIIRIDHEGDIYTIRHAVTK